MNEKIPVTVLTGFLGSGKTTLLNRILAVNHGQRIAVIENEFGEVGIDQGLVINADEEIFETNNGCICCTVRGDLIRILAELVKRRDRFDRVVLETTGLANPGPVAQTFFVDEQVGSDFALDGIITLVDSKHVAQHLESSEEAREQVAFADVIVLNKTDLVDDGELVRLEQRLRSMNAMARISRARNAEVAMETVLGVGGFDLARALEYKPTFLEPEYPFEWAAAFDMPAGKYRLQLQDGPDAQMKVAFCRALESDAGDPARAAERVYPWFRDRNQIVIPGSRLHAAAAVRSLEVSRAGEKHFSLAVKEAGVHWLFAEHLPEEFDLQVLDCAGNPLRPQVTRAFAISHTHEEAVGSLSLESDRPVDLERFREWLAREMRINGASIYRMKGFLNFQGHDERVVLQGVHMLIDNTSLGPWGARPRRTQLVFIGKNLDRGQMRLGFESCLC